MDFIWKGVWEKIRERREEHEVQISGRIQISETSTYPHVISYIWMYTNIAMLGGSCSGKLWKSTKNRL